MRQISLAISGPCAVAMREFTPKRNAAMHMRMSLPYISMKHEHPRMKKLTSVVLLAPM